MRPCEYRFTSRAKFFSLIPPEVARAAGAAEALRREHPLKHPARQTKPIKNTAHLDIRTEKSKDYAKTAGTMTFRVLYQDEHLVAIDKPAGFYVHPPEDGGHRISRNSNCLFLLRKQTGKYLYPVHRLDRATSGVLLFAFTLEAASHLSEQFRKREIRKSYYAVVRGWTDNEGTFNSELTEDKSQESKSATTLYSSLARVELPNPIGRYSTARYSLVQVEPLTGRMHQIRKHFSSASHPLIGDTTYGDGKHNRFFKELNGKTTLFLKAYSLSFKHPTTGEPLRVHARWTSSWLQIFDRFGACPYEVGLQKKIKE